MRSTEEFLLNHPLLNSLDPEIISKLAECASRSHFAAGQYVFRQGQAATKLYLIESGRIELELFSATGGPLVVQTLEGFQVLGWSWLIAPYEWCFDARAVQPTDLIELDAVYLQELMEKDHDLGYELLQRFVRVIVERLYAERLQLVNVFAAHS